MGGQPGAGSCGPASRGRGRAYDGRAARGRPGRHGRGVRTARARVPAVASHPGPAASAGPHL